MGKDKRYTNVNLDEEKCLMAILIAGKSIKDAFKLDEADSDIVNNAMWEALCMRTKSRAKNLKMLEQIAYSKTKMSVAGIVYCQPQPH